MRISIPQLLNLGLSGYTFVGDDIGGFAGSPTPELLTRWMELGAFNPIYRNHGAKGTRNREPWVDGPEHEAIRKKYIELRYQLLPYIYTEMEEAAKTGVPLMRPMFLEFPNEKDFETMDTEFMFGSELLIAPKVDEKFEPYDVKLPAGTWYDFWTGHKVTASTLTVNPPLEAVPIYVRGGSVLAEQPVVQNTDEVPQGPLQISVYPGPDCRGSIYQDDGNTLAYQHGEFVRMQFTCEARPESLRLKFTTEQSQYTPWWRNVNFVFFGIISKPATIVLDGKSVSDWQYDSAKGAVSINLKTQQAGEIVINVH